MNPTLTPKQIRFCTEYLVDLNGTQAATRAGYSAKCAYSTADKLLKNPAIQAKIEDLRQSQQERTEIDADRVLEKLWKVANFDIRSVCDFDGGKWKFKPFTQWDSSAFEVITIAGISRDGDPQIKTESKLAALDAISKQLGLYSDFNIAIATLRKYGLNVRRDSSHRWIVDDESIGSPSSN